MTAAKKMKSLFGRHRIRKTLLYRQGERQHLYSEPCTDLRAAPLHRKGALLPQQMLEVLQGRQRLPGFLGFKDKRGFSPWSQLKSHERASGLPAGLPGKQLGFPSPLLPEDLPRGPVGLVAERGKPAQRYSESTPLSATKRHDTVDNQVPQPKSTFFTVLVPGGFDGFRLFLHSSPAVNSPRFGS